MKINTERLHQLAKPRLLKDNISDNAMKAIGDHDFDIGISKTIMNLDQNSEIIKKIKYKDQFLSAIKQISPNHASDQQTIVNVKHKNKK